MTPIFRKTGPVIWDATIDNIKNTRYETIDKQTPAQECYDKVKRGTQLIVIDNNKPIGVLDFYRIDEKDLSSNKTAGQLNYYPAEIKDRETRVGEAYDELKKGNAILVKGADDKITGVITMSDYSRKRFT